MARSWLKTNHKLKIASALGRAARTARSVTHRGEPSDRVRVRRSGVEWELNLSEGIELALYLALYEPMTRRAVLKMVRPGCTVLDIGANIGAYALPLAGAVGPTGRVLAFEPTDYAYGRLVRNIELNPELGRRIIPHQMMLVAEDDDMPDAEVYSSWPLDQPAGAHPLHGGQAKALDGARALTLDTAVRNANVDRVDFVKLDVDGYECDVLAGAADTLSTHVPPIFMELAPYCLRERGTTLETLLDLLDSLGYRLQTLSGQSVVMNARELESSIPPGSSTNVLAIPKR